MSKLQAILNWWLNREIQRVIYEMETQDEAEWADRCVDEMYDREMLKY